jgi:hypothetical protein
MVHNMRGSSLISSLGEIPVSQAITAKFQCSEVAPSPVIFFG